VNPRVILITGAYGGLGEAIIDGEHGTGGARRNGTTRPPQTGHVCRQPGYKLPGSIDLVPEIELPPNGKVRHG
jgi:hypothetical protein